MPFGLPDIPNAPAAISAASLLTSDASSILGLLGFGSKPQWGIYKSGKAVIVPDSVIDVNYKNDWRIADYPMEQGSFQSYNKVNTPFDIKIRMTKGGKLAERTAFLASVDTLAQSLDLYDVVTPEKTYKSVNINHYDYRRTAHSGMGLIIVDIWVMEVRATVRAFLSSSSAKAPAIESPAVPSGASPISLGNVQIEIPSLPEIAPIAANITSEITSGLSEAIGSASPALGTAVGGFTDTISGLFSQGASGITDALGSQLTEVKGLISSNLPSLSGNLAGAMDGLSSGLSSLGISDPGLTAAMSNIGLSAPNSISLAIGGH